MVILTVAAIAYWWRTAPRPPIAEESLSITEILAGADTTGFARAVSPRRFDFPADHGPHPRFKTEWWYYTGNLVSKDGNGERFGFQLTFFRSALAPTQTPGASAWRTNQVYMAHFGLTDVSRKGFKAFERFSRAANELAGARAEPFKVWLDDWYAEAEDSAERRDVPMMRLRAVEDDAGIDLKAISLKQPVLQGVNGLSQKGNGVGSASYYYSLTRMVAEGLVQLPDRTVPVVGTMWMDREWGTSALEAGQVGWDWFALQLNDSTELMYYQLRRDDGSADSNSRGAFVDERGAKTTLLHTDVRLNVLDRWTSQRGDVYPSRWRVRVEKLGLDVAVTPLVSDQELDLSFRYWEGAVRITGNRNRRDVDGYGYVELTGYAERAIEAAPRRASESRR